MEVMCPPGTVGQVRAACAHDSAHDSSHNHISRRALLSAGGVAAVASLLPGKAANAADAAQQNGHLQDLTYILRFSHQESVPVEGRDRRRWPSLQRVVRDFERGPSEQAPAKRHSALGRLTALTCRDASLARPWTANPGEKTSLFAALLTSGVGASASLVGLTLTTFVLGLGLGQLLGGPISDQRGRRVPMIG